MVDLIRESLAGKVAVVLGVGSGQGISTARMFINFGAKVALVSRKGSNFGLVESSTIRIYKCDAEDEKALAELRDKILSDFGSIDVVCNNVGKWVEPSKNFPDNPKMIEVFNANVLTHLNSIRIFSEAMKSNGGSIVNIGASRNLFKGNDLSYTVSKSAVEELTRKAAEMLRPYNIRVNAVLPGAVGKEDTYFKVFPFSFTKFSETTVLEPIEVAFVTAFLSSDMSSGITGQSITVDKGLDVIK